MGFSCRVNLPQVDERVDGSKQRDTKRDLEFLQALSALMAALDQLRSISHRLANQTRFAVDAFGPLPLALPCRRLANAGSEPQSLASDLKDAARSRLQKR